MKTKILSSTLMMGLAIHEVMAQATPTTSAPIGSPPVQNQIISPQNITSNQVVSTNNMNPASTNVPNGFSGDNGMTNGNAMTNGGNPYNPYANYTNPNALYVNRNSTNVNPYANYTNPNAMDNGSGSTNANATNAAFANTNWPATNVIGSGGNTNLSNTGTNHHWWKWW